MSVLRLCVCAGVGLLFAAAGHAQTSTAARPWQHISTPTVAQLRAQWLTPPPEYGPEPYYGMNGPVTLDTVRRDFDTMVSLGFRAVTIQYGFGSDRTYLSDDYLHFFRDVVLEAKKRDLRIWIVDDAGYPSGFAGGKFTSQHPEMRMQALVALSRTTVKPGERFQQTVPPEALAVTAIGSGGQTITVPLQNGAADWTAPPADGGSWTVIVVGHAFRTSPTRSDTNPKRVKDGSQSLEDYLDPAATAQFLAFTHEAYKRVVGDEFGKTILGFRGDEPDYSISGLPWTPKFFAAFEQAKGYDIRSYLATLLQPKDVTLTPEQLRAKADYYDVFADLFRDGFFKPQAEWCAANGLEYQVHLNHEEMQLALAHSEGSFFRDMRFVQVPGIDAIWHQIWTDTVSDYPRLASSAAHVYGHPRAFTESFAAYRPLPDVTMARYILNEQFARGVNLVEAMYFPATSTSDHGGPMAFMRDPAFPDLMHYTSRVSYLLSSGRPAANVALLLPSASLWMGDTKTDDTFVSTERLLSEHQVDFDVVDDDALASLLPLNHGGFTSMSGNSYRTVLVPPTQILSETLFSRLKQFATQGGWVVFLGNAPGFLATKNNLQARQVQPEDFTWATVVPGDLPQTPTPPAQPPAMPPDPQQVSPAMLAAVQAAVPQQALYLQTADTALKFTHRVLRDGDLYFLFNESAKPLQNVVELTSRGADAEAWDANTGQVTRLRGEHHGSALHLPIKLAPYESELVVVH